MKRGPALTLLSREHHAALALARLAVVASRGAPSARPRPAGLPGIFARELDLAEQAARQIGAYLRTMARGLGGPGGSRPPQRRSGLVPRPGGRPRSPEGSR
jgi:hypothetical protein